MVNKIVNNQKLNIKSNEKHVSKQRRLLTNSKQKRTPFVFFKNSKIQMMANDPSVINCVTSPTPINEPELIQKSEFEKSKDDLSHGEPSFHLNSKYTRH